MEKFNGLNVPPIKIDWEDLQEKYCECSGKCAGACKSCLYHGNNLKAFKTWFKSNLKNDEREDT